MFNQALHTYYPLIASILAILISQGIKLVIMAFSEKKIQWASLTRSGGMPSSHSALITATALSVGLKNGFDSSYFFISASLCFIVIYDARGIRYTVGKHARIINQTLLQTSKRQLNEQVGHSFPEIIFGILIGALIALAMYHILIF